MRKGKDPDPDLTNGSGSGRPKNRRIRIPNTAHTTYDEDPKNVIYDSLAVRFDSVFSSDSFVSSDSWSGSIANSLIRIRVLESSVWGVVKISFGSGSVEL
jgi:hypothetical protein